MAESLIQRLLVKIEQIKTDTSLKFDELKWEALLNSEEWRSLHDSQEWNELFEEAQK